MQKKIIRILAIFLSITVVFRIGRILEEYVRSPHQEKKEEGITVVATFFPLADFAREIGGKEVHVIQIVPDGVEVHEYEPSSQDIATILSADVVLVNGGGVDVWAEELLTEAQASGAVTVRMIDTVPFVEIGASPDDEHGGSLDPHAWLDLARAQDMVSVIAETFAQVDPENASIYTTNEEIFRTKLADLDGAFSDMRSSCSSRELFVTHNAFVYWELRYNIEAHAISGTSAEAEPSVYELTTFIRKAKELNASTIFFVSPESIDLATTIADEIGAKAALLNTLESRTQEQITQQATYLSLMQANLLALSEALSCQE